MKISAFSYLTAGALDIKLNVFEKIMEVEARLCKMNIWCDEYLSHMLSRMSKYVYHETDGVLILIYYGIL